MATLLPKVVETIQASCTWKEEDMHPNVAAGNQFSNESPVISMDEIAEMESGSSVSITNTVIPEILIDINEVADVTAVAVGSSRASNFKHTVTEIEMKLCLHEIFIEIGDAATALAVFKRDNFRHHDLVRPSYFYKAVEASFGFTAAAGYSILSSSTLPPPLEKFMVLGATMAGFMGTLSSMLLRDKVPKVARVVGKAGVFAGTIGVLGCYGMQMQLPSQDYWCIMCGAGALIPAAVLLYC